MYAGLEGLTKLRAHRRVILGFLRALCDLLGKVRFLSASICSSAVRVVFGSPGPSRRKALTYFGSGNAFAGLERADCLVNSCAGLELGSRLYLTLTRLLATSITVFARESLTSNREDVSVVRYSAYFTRLRIEYNDVVSRLKKVYAKSEVR